MESPDFPCLGLALTAKGIGPKGLKPLAQADIKGAVVEMAKGAPLPLAAAFLMGFQVLEKDPDERSCLLNSFLEQYSDFPVELAFLFEPFKHQCSDGIQSWIQKLIRGEELNREQCEGVIDSLLDPLVSEVYKAALLQGLRVKRETDSENEHLLSALRSRAHHETVDCPILVDLSLPYDGMSRNDDITLELAALLALMGQPCVLHATRGLGPKYGAVILDRLENCVVCDFSRAQRGLKEVGVAILDQAFVFPLLHQVLPLRNAMRKRPFLATMEKMLMPLIAQKNIIVTGYVHAAYRDAIPEMLTRVGHYDEVLLLKGLEGSVILDPFKQQSILYCKGKETREVSLPRWDETMIDKRCEVKDRWWKDGDHRNTQRLLFTAGTILNQLLGNMTLEDILSSMKTKLEIGLLDQQLNCLESIYPISKQCCS